MSYRNPRRDSVNVHQFAMIPRAEIPRSGFRMQRAYKTTFGGRGQAGGAGDVQTSWLYPVLVEEVLPGDTWSLRMTAFARLATPLFPVLDNLYLDTFFFYVPNRLCWDNWQKFMGERFPLPTSSIDFTVPQVVLPAGGAPISSLQDYMGLPTVGQVGGGATVSVSALPMRAYALIWNEWFRDQNLTSGFVVPTGDGPDPFNTYALLPRAKRHDYFTSCLPWPQKGGVSVPLPLGTSAPVVPNPAGIAQPRFWKSGTQSGAASFLTVSNAANPPVLSQFGAGGPATDSLSWAKAVGDNTGLIADLSAATAATINQLRQSFQIQRLLERDARGGTRYTEILRAHFGVVSPDARLQRPEYLGGGSSPVSLNPVAQTAEGSTPQGTLSAIGTSLVNQHGFTQSFVEHGYVIGLVNVRADLTYQQGLRRHWSRLTRYDYFWPVFSHLGEQAVLSKEIYCDGSAADNDVFGYQERWAEYRYLPSEITGLFRSTATGTLDAWHYAQRFSTRPLLNGAFINDAPPLNRIIATLSDANGQQFLFDAFFDVKVARPMPLYSVPGMIDHF